MSAVVVFDLETGGLELHHPIIQIAAVAMDGGREVGRFEAKIQFNPADCDPKALELNGHTEEAWMLAQTREEVATRFAKWLNGFKSIEKISQKTGKPYRVARLSGYNAAVFDAPRLQKLFRDLEIFLPADYIVLDVFQLVMWYFEINGSILPENYRLKTVCEFFGVPLTDAHDALADTLATAALAEAVGQALADYMVRTFGGTTLQHA